MVFHTIILTSRNTKMQTSMVFKGLLVLVLLSVSFSQNYHYGVEGARRNSFSSNEKQVAGEEDSELLRELGVLNKPSIKSVQTEVGDIFDCVDIHKQPAFDHPLLKDHKIQMKPSSHQARSTGASVSVDEHSSIPLNRIGCPDGSVPIRRIEKEHLKRAKSFSENEFHQLSSDTPGAHRALIRTKPDSNQIYFGLSALVNIYNPVVGPDQLSTGQLWVEQVDNGQFNSIQAGWMVAPKLFNDTQTRLFTNWRVTNLQDKGCYNIMCPGFVQVSRDFPLGINFPAVSSPRGAQVDMLFTIQQDKDTKNWWLSLLDGYEHIGYWTNALVPALTEGSPLIAWGGVAKGIPQNSPPMGSGIWPNKLFTWACYMKRMRVNVATRFWEDPNRHIMESIVDDTHCYDMKYYGHVDTDIWHALEFGGPGGSCSE